MTHQHKSLHVLSQIERKKRVEAARLRYRVKTLEARLSSAFPYAKIFADLRDQIMAKRAIFKQLPSGGIASGPSELGEVGGERIVPLSGLLT